MPVAPCQDGVFKLEAHPKEWALCLVSWAKTLALRRRGARTENAAEALRLIRQASARGARRVHGGARGAAAVWHSGPHTQPPTRAARGQGAG